VKRDLLGMYDSKRLTSRLFGDVKLNSGGSINVNPVFTIDAVDGFESLATSRQVCEGRSDTAWWDSASSPGIRTRPEILGRALFLLHQRTI
jgi:hypothetical protein